MTLWAWHGIWYGLARFGMAYGIAWRDMAWYMISPGGHDMVYCMAWRGMARYIVSSGGHGMVYDKAWRGMAWYMEMLMLISCLWHCLRLWCRSHVEKPMSVGGPVHTYRTRSQLQGPLHARSVHIYSSCSLWAVTVYLRL